MPSLREASDSTRLFVAHVLCSSCSCVHSSFSFCATAWAPSSSLKTLRARCCDVITASAHAMANARSRTFRRAISVLLRDPQHCASGAWVSPHFRFRGADGTADRGELRRGQVLRAHGHAARQAVGGGALAGEVLHDSILERVEAHHRPPGRRSAEGSGLPAPPLPPLKRLI